MRLLYQWGGFRPVAVPKRGRRHLGEWSLEIFRGEMRGLPCISPTTRSEEKRGNGADESIPQINSIKSNMEGEALCGRFRVVRAHLVGNGMGTEGGVGRDGERDLGYQPAGEEVGKSNGG
ncbi:hypothetical protein AVEN_268889-1 [Araneus ventricosus]|uniref:Uncharacterized protein n=1 Tax=Araneus ventricosus TaxID=182803 RepID=A0A4Y2P7L9_ARAVE|nr:hypothetical protein AVEN_268889-1 [Araneus ventricosus]